MKIGIVIALVALVSVSMWAQEAVDIKDVLNRPVSKFRSDGQNARTVLEGIGQAYQIPIIIEPEIDGDVTFSVYNANLRMVFEAICAPKGWSYEILPAGYLVVRRFVTRNYAIDYLQASQSSSSNGSVSLSSAGGSSSSTNGSQNQNSGGGVNGQNGGGSGGGTASLSVSQENKTDFWAGFESDLKGMLEDGEKLTTNKFAGIVQLRGSLGSHARIESYISRIMSRVRREVIVQVQILDVQLSNQFEAGIDWNQAVTQAGGLTVGPIASTTTAGVNGIGSFQFAQSTFNGTIAAGKLKAVLTALKEQGNTRILSKPEISVMNNTTGYVQLSEDVPFFSRTDSFDPGVIVGGGTSQSTVRTNYGKETLSFGNLLEVTAQISDGGETQLSIQPSITRQLDTVVSPDGAETAAKTGVKRLRSVITLRDGETHVLGGFISEDEGTKTRSVPIVDALPIVGKLFQSKGNYKTRQELAVLITVHIRDPRAMKPEEVVTPSADKTLNSSTTPKAAPGTTVPNQVGPAAPVAGGVERVGPSTL